MKPLVRWLALLAAAMLSLQLFFVGRIALMVIVDPQSTAFERSEVWHMASEKSGPATAPRTGATAGPKAGFRWRQQWVDYEHISDHLKRAVISSEDDGFAYHDGVDWDALEKAWQKNAKAQEQAAKRLGTDTSKSAQKTTRPVKVPKVVGGSTITQQLAKNLFLSGERTLVRKGQEFVLTFMLETLLGKERILEIYLNSVEWGAGVFGAEAASQYYFHKPASKLAPIEAARLAVMLPRPKYFEKLPNSSYLAERAAVIASRMGGAELP